MTSRVEAINGLVDKDNLAESLYNRYCELKAARRPWETSKMELRDYIFATSTRTTTNAKLPWKNSTTVPKLCQIRDNLHANYMAALFTNEDWLLWKAEDEAAVSKEVREGITAYMRTKLLDSDFEDTVSALVLDYIDYGNCFADVEWVKETYVDSEGGEQVKYMGPRLIRINPMDIVFDITATDFHRTAKFTRHVMSLGDLEKYMKEHPDAQFDSAILQKIKDIRIGLRSYSEKDIHKAQGFSKDGFGSLCQYYNSGYVELIEFEGDYFNPVTLELHEGRRITIVDGTHVLRNIPITNIMGRSLKQHVGWRKRQDNLMAMGPLDNLVGMQYRIDHLQNLKSDVFDLTAFPPLKVRGQVEDFDWGPMERIYMDEDAEVDMMAPNVNALSADVEIDWIENKMEEMAGAPRQALGIRTPGEKTKYEVQTLENNASRVFQSKITHFEKHFLEPLINSMLALARENVETSDVARATDPTFGFEKFLEITPDLLKSKGKLRPIGARHFAQQANMLQNYTAFRNSSLGNDPAVMNHISGIKEAEIVEELLGIGKRKMVRPNVRIEEQKESQMLMQTAQAELAGAENELTMTEEAQIANEIGTP